MCNSCLISCQTFAGSGSNRLADNRHWWPPNEVCKSKLTSRSSRAAATASALQAAPAAPAAPARPRSPPRPAARPGSRLRRAKQQPISPPCASEHLRPVRSEYFCQRPALGSSPRTPQNSAGPPFCRPSHSAAGLGGAQSSATHSCRPSSASPASYNCPFRPPARPGRPSCLFWHSPAAWLAPAQAPVAQPG